MSHSSSCTCVLNDWRKARGTQAGGAYCRSAILESAPVGFFWSLCQAQSCNEEKACLAPSLRRVSGESATQVIHDRGPPLVFLAGEQGHGGAYVFVCNLGAICDNVALSQKMVSEWSDIFEPLGLALHKTEEHMGRGEALGTELDGRELSSRVTSKPFWMMRQGLTALEGVIGHCTFVGLEERSEHLTLAIVTFSPIWNEVLAELRCFW